VEYVFNYPGLGTLLLTAVQGLDYPLMQALFLLITLAVMLSVLAADLVTAFTDPRTRETS
ncbi:MAG: ABC transporter permease subunit, partial [Streptosporangiaceae bacterium]